MYANQNQGQVQNKPTTAYWLSMIGGIIGLLASFLVVALGALGIFDTQLI
jgi:Flp pilus assembly protein protease CpaA